MTQEWLEKSKITKFKEIEKIFFWKNIPTKMLFPSVNASSSKGPPEATQKQVML